MSSLTQLHLFRCFPQHCGSLLVVDMRYPMWASWAGAQQRATCRADTNGRC